VPSSRPEHRFLDILDNIRLIQTYLHGMDRAAFDVDSRTRDAVERCLERISEAASKLGPQAEDLAPGPPWHAIRALGNVLRHAYDQVHPGRLWEIATRDLASLAEAVEQAIERLEKASSPSE
jgi:uncharacterized protein with HEPN domain